MSGPRPPRVSVCIPAYNYGRFLPDALGSALGQTFGDLEVVVVDNASTDDTPAVAAGWAARDPRVRYLRNPENMGAQRNLNRCLEEARGEYVSLLMADDLLEPRALERLVAALDADPGVVLAGGARVVVTEDLRPSRVLSYGGPARVVEGREAIRSCLRRGNRIGEPSAVLLRRRDAARGFDTGYRQLIDLEMWFHLLKRGRYAFVGAPTCRFRVHGAAESRRNVEALAFIPEFLRLAEAYAPATGRAGRSLDHAWRAQLAWDVWLLQHHGLPLAEVHRAIRGFYSLPAFYLRAPGKALASAAGMVRGRLARLGS